MKFIKHIWEIFSSHVFSYHTDYILREKGILKVRMNTFLNSSFTEEERQFIENKFEEIYFYLLNQDKKREDKK